MSEYYAAKYESEQDPENQFYVTLEEVAQASKKLDLTKLWDDQDFLNTYTSNWNDYIDSISFVKYLMTIYGKEKTLRMIAENDDESLREIFGKSLIELERDWKQAK